MGLTKGDLRRAGGGNETENDEIGPVLCVLLFVSADLHRFSARGGSCEEGARDADGTDCLWRGGFWRDDGVFGGGRGGTGCAGGTRGAALEERKLRRGCTGRRRN